MNQMTEQTAGTDDTTEAVVPTGAEVGEGRITGSQLRGSRQAFAIAALLLAVGGVRLFDQIGPVAERGGTVDDLHVERVVRRHHVDDVYVVAGRDSSGARFELDVNRATFDRASEGDPVTVERSLLSGRPTTVTGPGWASDRAITVILPALMVLVGLVFAIPVVRFNVVDLRRRGTVGQRRRQLRVLTVMTAVVAIGSVIWVGISRDAAMLGAPSADGSPTVADVRAVNADECAPLRRAVRAELPALRTDGRVDAGDYTALLLAALGHTQGCGQVTEVICDEVGGDYDAHKPLWLARTPNCTLA